MSLFLPIIHQVFYYSSRFTQLIKTSDEGRNVSPIYFDRFGEANGLLKSMAKLLRILRKFLKSIWSIVVATLSYENLGRVRL
jgi:hypothetical protein